MNANNTQPLPSLPQLIKATALALMAAALILITIVLPAEYGIDPTGIGKAMRLTDLGVGRANAAIIPVASAPLPDRAPVAPQPAAPVMVNATLTKTEVPFRTDELSMTLQPGEGVEIEALMRKGEQVVFKWTTDGGKVNFDMHGERLNAGDKFTSYWKGQQQASAQGAFVAPFDGTHGWYWRNRGDKAVMVTVKVSGFHEKLFKPS